MERGLVHEGLPLHLYKNLTDEKFSLELVYSATQAKKFNKEIDYVNRFFPKGYQFQHVSPSEGETQIPNMDNVPLEFFVELLNSYNKKN